ncbi:MULTISPECIES: hypothetical protein [unclassified Streptomyces]|uniref:hypothetical protein n=1 Tax=unclassified Streptomyces TaxID=2593676 RepID=UPI0040435F2B
MRGARLRRAGVQGARVRRAGLGRARVRRARVRRAGLGRARLRRARVRPEGLQGPRLGRARLRQRRKAPGQAGARPHRCRPHEGSGHGRCSRRSDRGRRRHHADCPPSQQLVTPTQHIHRR